MLHAPRGLVDSLTPLKSTGVFARRGCRRPENFAFSVWRAVNAHSRPRRFCRSIACRGMPKQARSCTDNPRPTGCRHEHKARVRDSRWMSRRRAHEGWTARFERRRPGGAKQCSPVCGPPSRCQTDCGRLPGARLLIAGAFLVPAGAFLLPDYLPGARPIAATRAANPCGGHRRVPLVLDASSLRKGRAGHLDRTRKEDFPAALVAVPVTTTVIRAPRPRAWVAPGGERLARRGKARRSGERDGIRPTWGHTGDGGFETKTPCPVKA